MGNSAEIDGQAHRGVHEQSRFGRSQFGTRVDEAAAVVGRRDGGGAGRRLADALGCAANLLPELS